MSDLHDMMARWAQPGVVDWIGARPARAADIQVLDRADITDAGVDRDRGRAGKRAVTLMQAEHVPVIAACLGRDALDPATFRRNILVRRLNLNGLKGREVQVGTAILRFTTICAPCSLMERLLGHGAYAAMRGHGGWCAEVVRPGSIALGDQVRPID
ncbi:MOSC domain-containing protein [Tateyamaria omphalii]|uniref:Sulfurase n=1 Tax=Tateyamaria omphalii TaxID=299262 RepID=A0A1P8MZS3_9RHOB|nr:MOSC domain-containing protein [Tateyamaria omphalii]APX13566.1 sulfurase [Tateyamaria omphalii]